MPAEFDRYAAEYEELLRDPIRDGFSGGARFFIRSFFQRRNRDTERLHWLDAVCGKGELLGLGGACFERAMLSRREAARTLRPAQLDVIEFAERSQ